MVKRSKFIIFVITTLSISIVVFNNFTDIIDKIFKPSFNIFLWLGFGIITLATMTYLVWNKDMF